MHAQGRSLSDGQRPCCAPAGPALASTGASAGAAQPGWTRGGIRCHQDACSGQPRPPVRSPTVLPLPAFAQIGLSLPLRPYNPHVPRQPLQLQPQLNGGLQQPLAQPDSGAGDGRSFLPQKGELLHYALSPRQERQQQQQHLKPAAVRAGQPAAATPLPAPSGQPRPPQRPPNGAAAPPQRAGVAQPGRHVPNAAVHAHSNEGVFAGGSSPEPPRHQPTQVGSCMRDANDPITDRKQPRIRLWNIPCSACSGLGVVCQGVLFWMNAVSTAMRAAAGASGTSHGAAPARRPATVPTAEAASAAPCAKADRAAGRDAAGAGQDRGLP